MAAILVERMLGVAKLDLQTFEEVEHDATATGQAMIVVVLSSVAAGIGALGTGGIPGLLVGALVALVGWVLWSLSTFLIGTMLMPEEQTEANFGQMLRVMGFAMSPGVLYVLGIIPVIGSLFGFVIGLWTLACMVVGVRQALDYSNTGRAIAVCFIGWVVFFVLRLSVLLFLALLGISARGAAGALAN